MIECHAFLPIERLHATDATTTAAANATRALRPRAIIAPTAMPAACHTWIGKKNQAKPGSEEIRNARREGEL